MSHAASPSPSPPPNPLPDLPEDPIAARAKACEDLILACVEGKFSIVDLVDKLTVAGATPAEAEDFIQQAQQSLSALANLREATPLEAANALSWNLLRAKVISASSLINPSPFSKSLSSYAKQLANLISSPSSSQSSGAIPSSVLDAAPHLAKLVSDLSDSHLEATWKLREAYATDKAIDSIIDLLQRQHMHEPIARSIWRDIIQDRYVNFEKLYVSILPGYDHHDEAKEFVSGYAIIKKDSVNVCHPLSDEADWIVSSVLGKQLSSWCIRTAKTNLSPLTATKNKRPLAANSPTSPLKRSSSICLNWNFSNCADPCPNKRRHGICSECGDKHRARDVDECFSALRASRQRAGGGQDSSLEAQAGPRRFEAEKRKGEPLDPLRYRRFTWLSNKLNNTSPSALYTESAPPLPSPPEHLLKTRILMQSISLEIESVLALPLISTS
ncbi:hypothetical protein IMY05_C4463000500 [Salix suchowensis]|nr:hypothetical protein IMY05_C4463000500 [Salix suchowensis]